MSLIKKLNQNIINQIAAGEVIERPFAVIKELVENALDAEAQNIKVSIRSGGKSFIEIEDDGLGMSSENIKIAIERHTTSKLPENNLINIKTFGFRGEALSSIAAISRLTIISQPKGVKAWKVEVHGGEIIKDEPTSQIQKHGTKITVKDLFYATPARLKFLKSDQSEQIYCFQIIKKLALSNHNVSFQFFIDEKLKLHYRAKTSLKERILEVMDQNFEDNAHEVDYANEFCSIKGMISPPTLNRSSNTEQYLFVNNRPVKDKYLNIALKLAYSDLVPSNRYPLVCLYIELPLEEIDVNVHPAKTEVRFRDIQLVKQSVVTAIKNTLHKMTHKTSTHIVERLIPNITEPRYPKIHFNQPKHSQHIDYAKTQSKIIEFPTPVDKPVIQQKILDEPTVDKPFGTPKLQIFDMFIIAEKNEEMIVIDQHAAHERVVYEQYKKNKPKLAQSPLLIPEIIDINVEQFDFIKQYQRTLSNTYIQCECFGENQIIVKSIPEIFKNKDIKKIIVDFLINLIEYDDDYSTEGFINQILATAACHNSIRAGQKLSLHEMEHLLKEMAETPNIAQCNHGRPTFTRLHKKDFEKLFERR